MSQYFFDIEPVVERKGTYLRCCRRCGVLFRLRAAGIGARICCPACNPYLVPYEFVEYVEDDE